MPATVSHDSLFGIHMCSAFIKATRQQGAPANLPITAAKNPSEHLSRA